MLSEISQDVLEAAHDLNQRDAQIVDAKWDGTYEEQKENFLDDDTIWEQKGGVARKSTKHGGSYTAEGPYPRNRRILADITLIVGWDIETARRFERRVIARHVGFHRRGLDLSDPDTITHIKDGTPFTWDHISWSFLKHCIEQEIRDMAPEKLAAVRAGVIEKYPGNSQKPKESDMRGTKRKRVDHPDDDEVERQQTLVDAEARLRAAVNGKISGWESPNDVKHKLKAFVDSGELRIEALCQQLKVSEDDYKRFIAMRSERDNMGSIVYHNGREFLNDREKRGLHTTPAAKKQRRDSAQGSSPATRKNSPREQTKNSGPSDISDIHLEGEEHERVPIFDTCNDVRRKINAHLKKFAMSQTQFARDLNEHVAVADNVDQRKIGLFLKKSGANDGAKSPIFYAAYVYFEKLRIKDGKDKTKTRKEMEEVWGARGMSRDVDKNTRVLCYKGSRPYGDKYGKMHIS